MKTTRRLQGVLVITVAALAMTACATQEQTGRLLGGAAGAAVGTQVGDGTGRTIAIIGGAILGSVIGGALGGRMDDNDRLVSAAALENSRVGQSTRWVNPDSGNSYDIQPTRTYETNNSPCRDYTMNAVIDGRNEKIDGTACRQADGSWR